MVVGTGLVALSLDLVVWRVAGSGGCRHFHRRCGGHRVFVSVQQNNDNTLHTNPNCKIVQYSTESM